jgi:hypothetical protein
MFHHAAVKVYGTIFHFDQQGVKIEDNSNEENYKWENRGLTRTSKQDVIKLFESF